ncbi:MAG: hypothetical protein HC836_39795 [Richelia sp. RM2_1_2]|nr:hypothetical protein [Richelia sp. SM1_7_0]NJN11741.1 hypothetical protein [Richelia sp. RM1_1_1]NJO30956.1 hypothetical protein [Richelia sp. SL_2_1]NJO64106.1 hypothetical protein [Richelia sp. RM2_1_2]
MCNKQIDFRWRYQPCQSIDVQLMDYIQASRITGKTQMMLVAVRSFWLTHAVADYSDSEKEVQRIARSCVKALRTQAQEIVELAGLEGLEDSSLKFLTQYYSWSNSQSRVSHSNNNDYDDAGLSNFM